jgi:hypothetical protein
MEISGRYPGCRSTVCRSRFGVSGSGLPASPFYRRRCAFCMRIATSGSHADDHFRCRYQREERFSGRTVDLRGDGLGRDSKRFRSDRLSRRSRKARRSNQVSARLGSIAARTVASTSEGIAQSRRRTGPTRQFRKMIADGYRPTQIFSKSLSLTTRS